MTQTRISPPETSDLAFLEGGGEMGARIRSFDWASNPVGPVSSWPQSVRTAVSICLTSRFPIVLWLGPELRLIYNDAWRPVLGQSKHPRALGSPGHETWPEVWHIIGPMLDGVLTEGKATWSDDQLLMADRNGYLEEAYFTYSYSPILGREGRIDGVFSAVNETTLRVVGERRLHTLRDLASSAAAALTAEDACRQAVSTLARNPADVPFALIYLVSGDGRQAWLCDWTPGVEMAESTISLTDGAPAPWPIADAIASGTAHVVTDLEPRCRKLSPNPWNVVPRQAVVLPLMASSRDRAVAALVLGVNPCRALDDEHRGFHDLLAAQVATVIANGMAHEEERRRAEALAELDRAKTAFFSNVSHEFRTPLTLMLGPVEDLLAGADSDLEPRVKAQLDVVNRNGSRLLRLVNTLLEFSRIEAGRVRARFRPTDLPTFTTDLASVFRSACERAGLQMSVQCEPLPDQAWVDRDMWEKIVLNLLSNAFKFTFDGEIAVELHSPSPGVAQLVVRDTGIGIAAEEMPFLFERFHRIEAARGRTHEGTGIGLALVHELVRLHGGAIEATSEPGVGTTFTVTIPLGRDHLPADQVVDDDRQGHGLGGVQAYVDEALRWLPHDRDEQDPSARQLATDALAPTMDPGADGTGRPRVLVADDNADMREYIQRLLERRFDVLTTDDGISALEAARASVPDLVLTDAMMPRQDGHTLVRALRGDPRTRDVPIIMLSARAGEQSRIEGMESGVDDYLEKPFSARELLARVDAHVRIARMRRDSQAALRASEDRHRILLGLLPVAVYTCEAPSGVITYYNEKAAELWGRAPRLGDTDERFCGSFQLWRTDGSLLRHDETPMAMALREGRSFRNESVIIEHPDGQRRSVRVNIDPIRDSEGRVVGAINAFHDTTTLVKAEETLRDSEQRLRLALEAGRMGTWEWSIANGTVSWSPSLEAIHGLEPGTFGRTFEAFTQDVHPDDREMVLRTIAETVESGREHEIEYRIVLRDGSVRWVEGRGKIFHDAAGKAVRLIGVCTDVTQRKEAEKSLMEADRRKDEFLAMLAHELRNPLAPLRSGLHVLRHDTDPARAQSFLDMLDRQVAHMVRLVEDLMDVSRITRGTMELRRERIELRKVIEQAIETSRPLIDEHGHALDVSIADGSIVVHADATRLAQAVSNLLNNAARYTPRGGRITVLVDREGSDAVVRVRDTGIGIPRQMLGRIFEMFSQVEHPEGREHGGLGVGLTLVQRLIEMHGGRVEVHSGGRGQGSEFILRMPVTTGQVPPVASGKGNGEAKSRTHRILVVDDNADASSSLAMMLQLMGNEAHTAQDGYEALEVGAAMRPDVILLDIGMPRLDGYETARRIRSAPWGRDVRLVALTGWGQAEDKERTRQAGFDAHLVKPLDPAALERFLVQDVGSANGAARGQ